MGLVALMAKYPNTVGADTNISLACSLRCNAHLTPMSALFFQRLAPHPFYTYHRSPKPPFFPIKIKYSEARTFLTDTGTADYGRCLAFRQGRQEQCNASPCTALRSRLTPVCSGWMLVGGFAKQQVILKATFLFKCISLMEMWVFKSSAGRPHI